MNVKSNLQSSFSDQKSRLFLFVMVGAIVVIFLVYYITFSSSGTTQSSTNRPTAKSQVDNITQGVKSVPGTGQTTAEYKKVEEKYEQRELEKALKQSQQGTPSAIISSLDFSDVNPERQAYQEKLKVPEETEKQYRDRMRLLEEARKRVDKRNKEIMQLLVQQAKVLADSWKVPTLQVVNGKNADLYNDIQTPMSLYVRSLTEPPATQSTGPQLCYKAGDILFGVVLTSVDSNQPKTPVLVRIISGPLKDSKLIGKIDQSTVPRNGTDPRVSQALTLNFSIINIPGSTRSKIIKAVAIDPETASASLASTVDNHYLLRYGTFFAAQFLSGLGSAISQQTATTVVTGNGTADIGRTKGFTGTDEAKIAIGRTAEQFSESLDILAKPPTITIASGTPVGILLENDFGLTACGDNAANLVSDITGDDNGFINNQGNLVQSNNIGAGDSSSYSTGIVAQNGVSGANGTGASNSSGSLGIISGGGGSPSTTTTKKRTRIVNY